MTDEASTGVALLHITIALLVLSWVTVVARLAVRTWLKPEAMGMDDYLMVAGLVRPLVRSCLDDPANQLTAIADSLLRHLCPSHRLYFLRCRSIFQVFDQGNHHAWDKGTSVQEKTHLRT